MVPKVALASCNHQNSKLCAVAGAEGFWVAELRVRQLKIGRKSCYYGFLIKILEKKTGNTGPGPLTSHVCGVQHIFWTRHVTS